MRAEIAFGSGAGVVLAGDVVALPDSVPVVAPVSLVDVPVALADDVVAAGVDAVVRLLADASFAVLSDFALPDAFDNAFVALSDLVLPDTFGDPLVWRAAVVVALFEPPFATCTPAFGLFGPWAAVGATVVVVANDSANAITRSGKRVMGSSGHSYVKGSAKAAAAINSSVSRTYAGVPPWHTSPARHGVLAPFKIRLCPAFRAWRSRWMEW